MPARLNLIDRLRRALDYLENPSLFHARRDGLRVDFVLELIKLRDRFNFQPRTVVDVGANQGDFARAAQFVHPTAQIFAFEPIPELAEGIRSMLGASSCQVFALALDEQDGTRELFVPRSHDLSSILPPDKGLSAQFGVEAACPNSILVNTRRLDNVVDLRHSRRPVLLKIDVQGAELRVLRGSERQLAAVDCIKLEFSFDSFYEGQPTLVELFEFLASHGFSRFVQMGSVVSGGHIRWCDFVFFREQSTAGQ